jgi:hypothetical protein
MIAMAAVTATVPAAMILPVLGLGSDGNQRRCGGERCKKRNAHSSKLLHAGTIPAP